MKKLKKSLSAVAIAALLPATVSVAHAGSFTIDGVLKTYRKWYPNISKVSNALPAGVTAHENIEYSHPNGIPLDLDIYVPSGKGPFPAVLIYHGGGWEAGDRQMERPLAKHLAARGYVAATVSYRMGKDGRFPTSIHDAKASVRWLRAHAAKYNVDPHRIAAEGASAGGQLVALLGATNGQPSYEGNGPDQNYSSTVESVVDIDGAADFTSDAFIKEETKKNGATTRYLGGPYKKRAATWEAASALLQLTPKSAPTLFLDSTSSPSKFWRRKEMLEKLRDLGIRSDMITFPHTPHPFWLVHPWFNKVVADIDQFLQQTLPKPKS